MKQKEQTAVEWLIEQLNNHQGNIDILDVANLNGYFEKAIEMEKEQIVHAFVVAENHQWDGVRHGCHYYRQKYEKTD